MMYYYMNIHRGIIIIIIQYDHNIQGIDLRIIYIIFIKKIIMTEPIQIF